MTRTAPAASAALLALLLSATSAAHAQSADARTVARVDSLFAEWNDPGSPGAAVAVLRDGRIVLERGYGSAQLEHGIPITPRTIFHVASVTKQFTAFSVALLAQQGKLALDDGVREHLPEFPDLGHRITIRQLIHHTSGVRDQWELLAMAGWRLDDVITKDHILRMMARQRELNFEPGTEHLYSNMGYTLLAEIVARAGGKPFPEWVRENVFEPLGMTASHMHDDHEHVVPGRAYSYRGSAEEGWRNAVLSYANAGATSMFTTAGDLARWLRNFETGQVGGAALIEQMRERAVLASGDTISYAFAIVRGEHRGRTTWSHGGADAGFRSFVLHIPEERLGVVVLSNLASFNPGRLAHQVADVFMGEAARVAAAAPPAERAEPEPAAPVSVPARLLAAHEGVYDVPGLGLLTVRREGGGLVAVVGGERYAMTAESDSIFRVEAASARIRFVREDGRSTAVVVTGPMPETRGQRVEMRVLTPELLAAYAGEYYSPELGTIYGVEARGDTLVAVHHRHGEIPLTQAGRDEFRGRQWFFRILAFTRDGDGAVDGFRLSGGRVRNLRFVKLAPGVLPP